MKLLFVTLAAYLCAAATVNNLNAQDMDSSNKEKKAAQAKPVVQLAKIEIDPSRTAEYRDALTTEITTSVRVEPGVVGLYAVADRDNPASVNILEVYADEDAYNSHIVSPHFLKYKSETADIVSELELVPAVPIVFGGRIGNEDNAVFPLGNEGLAEWFTGEVHVQSLVEPADMENLYSVGQVTFSPGGRTHWHTHPIGQTLLVLDGRGFYQERGKPAQLLTKGSVVAIPKDVEHWHGASDDTKLVHIAISNIENGSNVTWMAPVNDDEFAEANKDN